MSAEYNNLYMVVSVSLPYHTLATVIFFVVLCGGVVWHGVMYTRMCVFVRALYLCFYLFTEWKLCGTSLGWFWVRAVLQLVLDAMYKMTSHSRTLTKEKRFQRCRLLYYYFSVKSKANSIEKNRHTQPKNSQVHHNSSDSSFFFTRSFDKFLLLRARVRSIASWAEFVYQMLVYVSSVFHTLNNSLIRVIWDIVLLDQKERPLKAKC